MNSNFYTNYSDTKFIDKLKKSIDCCASFCFSVSFIKKAGLKLVSPNIEAALARGAKGKIITTTYQNFTDIDSLVFFNELQQKYKDSFECRLDKECFRDKSGNTVGFHSKGYIFEYSDHRELLVGSSNITVYALLKNIEWDVSIIDGNDDDTCDLAMQEFEYLWKKTIPLTKEIIEDYKSHLMYSIERWDMDYDVANSETKPNYMQRKALKELNRIRMMGSERALVVAAAGSGKTYLAAFDAFNFSPKRLLYIVHEGSILMKSFESFQKVFGSDRSYGIYNKDYKDYDADFVFSTNITMSDSLELFEKHDFDYIIVDECHHATATTYKKIINYFEPEFLLGITATPERMDEEDVFGLFNQNVPYELRLREAIINKLVVPFRYYGIRDELIEYGLEATKGHKFVEQFSDEKHCEFISKMIEEHRTPGQKLKALAFCRDIAHATRMADAMGDYYNTRYLTGKNSVGERVRAYKDLQDDNTDLEILFTVDILNEGVDIPGVNMVLFLRPTESQTIFIQQLGRGLRNYEGKEYVTVLDFIGNDYKRSVQIAFALGSLSENFVVEKNLVSELVKNDYKSLGLEEYGVEIHIDELSKKEINDFINQVNFNTKRYLQQDYENFKKYISSSRYPEHVDYLNNDYAPDLIKFMQSKIGAKKSFSYYGFLKAIDEDDIPAFSDSQEGFIKYISDMLPIVRPYEYLIVQKLIDNVGIVNISELQRFVSAQVSGFSQKAFEHAINYMLKREWFVTSDDDLILDAALFDTEFEEYIRDLLNYGLGKYDIEYGEKPNDELFHLWSSYRKTQVAQLQLRDPGDIMTGTKILDSVIYAYVTVLKNDNIKESLDYDDGYIDQDTFQWESVANVSARELEQLKSSKEMHIFVRKIENEDGITLPFTYIGKGVPYYSSGPKENGAHLFRVEMENTAPEDIYFDFKLRKLQ